MYPNYNLILGILGFWLVVLGIHIVYAIRTKRIPSSIFSMVMFVWIGYGVYDIVQEMQTPQYLLSKAAEIKDHKALIAELYRIKSKIPREEFVSTLERWRKFGLQLPDNLFE